ncbi:MAG: hypothetical protein WC455_16950 [Dehalococcoidia bacterium]
MQRSSDARGIMIIEGPDCTGKTTLCNELRRICPDALYIHATYPYENTADVRVYHLGLLRRAMMAGERRLVLLDRLWPSELVYGAVHRGGPQHLGYEMSLDRLVRKVAGIYVFALHGPREGYLAFAARCRREGRQEFYPTQAGAVYDAYAGLERQLREAGRNDVLRYLFAGQPEGYVAHMAGAFLKYLADNRGAQLQPALAYRFQNLAGHAGAARLLIIGDRPNVPAGVERWPFVGFGGCTSYMTRALAEAQVADHLVAWTNAREPGWELAAEHFTARKLPIVFMGQHAWAAADKKYGFAGLRPSATFTCPRKKGVQADGAGVYETAGGKVFRLAHPQFYRRFWNREKLLTQRLMTIKKEMNT